MKSLKNKKMNRGITLIALIITVIVLLILAAITIGSITGKNGIIKQANDAKSQVEIAEEMELIDMSALSAMQQDRLGEIKYNEFKNELDKNIVENAKRQYSLSPEKDSTKYIITYLDSKRSYIVNESGEVARIEGIGDSEVTICNIQINENIKSYNETLGSFPIAYNIVGEKDGQIVYDDIQYMVIDSVGQKQINFEAIIPQDTKLKINKVYSGVNYTSTPSTEQSFDITDGQDILCNFESTCNKNNLIKTNQINITYNYSGT